MDWQEKVGALEVKQQLRQNGEDAIAKGVFGVPTFFVDQELFWGVDATDFLIEYLQNPQLLKSGEMTRISNLPQGHLKVVFE